MLSSAVVRPEALVGKARERGRSPPQRGQPDNLRLSGGNMRMSLRLFLAAALALGVLTGAASAGHVPDQSNKMDERVHVAEPGDELRSRVLGKPRVRRLLHRRRRLPARVGTARRRADLRHLESGGSAADQGGSRATGSRTTRSSGTATATASPTCSCSRSTARWRAPSVELLAPANHGDPTGWEGVRIFELSDDPANPFATVTQVKAVYTGLRRAHDHALAGYGRATAS